MFRLAGGCSFEMSRFSLGAHPGATKAFWPNGLHSPYELVLVANVHVGIVFDACTRVRTCFPRYHILGVMATLNT